MEITKESIAELKERKAEMEIKLAKEEALKEVAEASKFKGAVITIQVLLPISIAKIFIAPGVLQLDLLALTCSVIIFVAMTMQYYNVHTIGEQATSAIKKLKIEIDTLDTEIVVRELDYAMQDIGEEITKDNDNVVTTYYNGRYTQ